MIVIVWQKLKKKIVQNICCQNYNAHTEPLFKKLSLLKVEDMLNLNTLKFYYKMKKGNIPEYFKSFTANTLDERHGRNTRHNSLIVTNRTRLKLSDKCLRNNLPVVLNATPQLALDKVSTHSYHGFSNYVKNLIISNYSAECNISNCYICRS